MDVSLCNRRFARYWYLGNVVVCYNTRWFWYLVSYISDVSFPSHMFINSNTKKFCRCNLLCVFLCLIVILTGMLILFFLVLNVMKFVLLAFNVNLLEYNHCEKFWISWFAICNIWFRFWCCRNKCVSSADRMYWIIVEL